MKIIKRTLVFLLALLLFAGCGKKSLEEVPEDQAQEILKLSQAAIQEIQEKGFAGLMEQMSPEMQEALTEEVQEKVQKDLEEKGAFKEFGEGAVVNDPDQGIYISQQEVQYEKGSLLFTVNFNEEKKIVGIFYK